ncbi:ribosomal subunit interface protein [Fusobacterium necrophorum subsp. funduliforme]|uniref:Ribosome hibernation promoting factor n=3 Tax=Fusobacterium necrophorum TaxID=859 RepID=A0AAN4AT35_9FUSO|nr:ribosome-associated translation inhibitor RaiA [Fusobacterium necrophorum]AVQ21735.1 ribosome-associated translation inhibitor RaiA [Fusobacterium necrophorum subsp. funduliforme]AYV95356.1 ribosome-associated translation inhibitor RaiA [Fusobacterium necrophorum subsp. funduliforme]EFS23171.1 ribosomal subunit interface protein [Fusobacterium necrophorum D12]EJU17536.1 ribosomal subunit interface protein [Fusobacterium necrophorum subsp. funduliforme Fnf 1007]EYD69379.1 sigma(54) modulatio
MKLSIQGKRLVLTDAIKAYAERKFEKVEKFHDGILEINVTLSAVKLKTGNYHSAEVLAYLSGKTLKATSTEEDLYFAIDQAADALEVQLKKHKDKNKRANSQKGGKSWKFDPESGIVTNQEERRMVKVLLPKKPMSMEEALLQLEVLDKQFFAFKSLETGKMSIVYKRKDGDYGYILDEE